MVESVTVGQEDDGQRLDRWLKKYYPATPFGQMQKILRTGQLRVDGKRAKGETRLAEGQVIRIPPQMNQNAAAERAGISEKDAAFIQSLVVYKDSDVIAINKPAGLASQGGTKIFRHVDGMLDGLSYGGERPRLVHRLDKETSGVMLLGRTKLATQALGEMFKERDTIRKYYWAVVAPAPEMAQGKVKSMLAKTGPAGAERMASVEGQEGKLALTYYAVMEDMAGKLAWVAFWPRTGRTHQIRVHALEMGTPLLGDFKYDPEQSFLRENEGLSETLHLHARRMILPHPITGETLDISAPLESDMRKTFKFFGFNADDKRDPFEDLD